MSLTLKQSAAKNIHRSQGDSLSAVVIIMASRFKVAHSDYVALSRETSLEVPSNLNLCEEKIPIDSRVVEEMTRLRQHA